MDNQILIQKFLHAELSEEEIVLFEKRFEDDVAFAQEVEASIVVHLKKSKDFKVELMQAVEENRISKIKEFLINTKHQNQEKTDQKAMEFLELCENIINEKHPTPVVLRNQVSENTDYNFALEAFKQQEYELAIQKLEELKKETNETLFYKGLSYLYLPKPNYTLAAFHLEQIVEGNKLFKQEEATWYLSICYFHTGEVTKAYDLLQTIVSEKSWKFKEAKKLLDFLVK